jgi:hypothetical protein
MSSASLQTTAPPRQPPSREEARAQLLTLQAKPNQSQLAREWLWSRSKVRRLIAACRAQGVIPPAATATKKRKSNKRAGQARQASIDTGASAPAPQAPAPSFAPGKDIIAMPHAITIDQGRTEPNGLGYDDDISIPDMQRGRSNDTRTNRRPSWRRRLAAAIFDNHVPVILKLAAVTLGTIGLVLNVNYYASMGRTPAEATMLAVVGAVIDVMMIWMLAVAGDLWRQRRRLAAGAAFVVWLFAALMSFLASDGFTSSNILDTSSSRAKSVSESAALAAKLDQLRRDRAAVTESRSPAEIDAVIQQQQPRVPAWKWKESNGCTTAVGTGPACRTINTLRQARADAIRRGELDGMIARAEDDFHALPAYSSADPGADMASKLLTAASFGAVEINAANVQTIRIAGLTLAPLSSGLLLFFANLLWRERGDDDDDDAPIM